VDKIVRTRPDRRRALEDELDVAVYALYEVTPEEIAQIETSSENTRSGKSVDDDGT
jgi:hypothetical protein